MNWGLSFSNESSNHLSLRISRFQRIYVFFPYEINASRHTTTWFILDERVWMPWTWPTYFSSELQVPVLDITNDKLRTIGNLPSILRSCSLMHWRNREKFGIQCVPCVRTKLSKMGYYFKSGLHPFCSVPSSTRRCESSFKMNDCECRCKKNTPEYDATLWAIFVTASWKGMGQCPFAYDRISNQVISERECRNSSFLPLSTSKLRAQNGSGRKENWSTSQWHGNVVTSRIKFVEFHGWDPFSHSLDH
jgi:hypothetical protein